MSEPCDLSEKGAFEVQTAVGALLLFLPLGGYAFPTFALDEHIRLHG